RLEGHVSAMATAELLFGTAHHSESLLYFYARQVVGIAVAVHGRLHRGPRGSGSIAHLGVGGSIPCSCGRTGCLEATVAEETVVARAVREGIIHEPSIGHLHEEAAAGHAGAIRLLRARAHALGRAVGILRDVLDPARVVLGGQAVTGAPDFLPDLLAGFAATTTLPGTDMVEVTRFGADVQAMAACSVLLAQLYADPAALT
ncbi:ROK family protein, partial [Amycolatopsis rhizosphaerae]